VPAAEAAELLLAARAKAKKPPTAADTDTAKNDEAAAKEKDAAAAKQKLLKQQSKNWDERQRRKEAKELKEALEKELNDEAAAKETLPIISMSADAESLVKPPTSEDEDDSDEDVPTEKEETGDGGENVPTDKTSPKKPPAGRKGGRKRNSPDRYKAPAAKKPRTKPAGATKSKEAAAVAARRRSIQCSSKTKKPAKIKALPDIPKGDLTANEAGVSRVKPHISKQCI